MCVQDEEAPSEQFLEIRGILEVIKDHIDSPEIFGRLTGKFIKRLDNMFEHDADIPYRESKQVLVPGSQQSYIKIGALSVSEFCYRLQGFFELESDPENQFAADHCYKALKWSRMLPLKIPETIYQIIKNLRKTKLLVDRKDIVVNCKRIRSLLELHLRTAIDPFYSGDPILLQAIHDGEISNINLGDM